MLDCSFLLELELLQKLLSIGIDFVAIFRHTGLLLKRWKIFLSVTIEGNADDSNLVEEILIIYMIILEYEANKLGLGIVYIDLLELPGLKVGIDV